jgi:hypothetical protein
MAFHDPGLLDPVVHCYARCFVCKRLIAIKGDKDDELILEEMKCPHCGVFVEEEQIQRSFAFNIFHTAAITSSNKIQVVRPCCNSIPGRRNTGDDYWISDVF